MKFASPNDTVLFIPDNQQDRPEGERIAFRIRVPAVADQPRLERAVAEAGGKQWNMADLIIAMADGVKAILPDENDPERVGILSELDTFRTELLEAAQAAILARKDGDEEGAAAANAAFFNILVHPRLHEIMGVVEEHYPRLRRMIADNSVYALIRGTVAARQFVMEAEGYATPLKRGLTGLSEESLRRISEVHRKEIGAFVDGLFRPSEAEAKNSVSPSGGPSEVTDSPAASTMDPTTP